MVIIISQVKFIFISDVNSTSEIKIMEHPASMINKESYSKACKVYLLS